MSAYFPVIRAWKGSVYLAGNLVSDQNIWAYNDIRMNSGRVENSHFYAEHGDIIINGELVQCKLISNEGSVTLQGQISYTSSYNQEDNNEFSFLHAFFIHSISA